MTRRRVQAILACSAAAGLVGAHAIAYLVALPDASMRSALLRTTGHGYFSAAVVVATVAGIFGVLAAAAIGFRAGARGDSVPLHWQTTVWRIAAVQGIAFLVLEGAERAAANIPPIALSARVVVVGIGVQAVVACVAALVLTLIARAAAGAAELLRTRVVRPRAELRLSMPVLAGLVPRPACAGSLHPRAPPASSR